jgi:hypothetical protein
LRGSDEMSTATLEVDTMDPKLLTEIQRQEVALADLPEEYEFPLFDGRRAIESQRKSGARTPHGPPASSSTTPSTLVPRTSGSHSSGPRI